MERIINSLKMIIVEKEINISTNLVYQKYYPTGHYCLHNADLEIFISELQKAIKILNDSSDRRKFLIDFFIWQHQRKFIDTCEPENLVDEYLSIKDFAESKPIDH